MTQRRQVDNPRSPNRDLFDRGDTRFERFDNFVGWKKKWIESRGPTRARVNREENRDGKLLLLFFSKFHYFESTGGRFVPGRVGSLNVSRSRGKDLKISSAHFTRAEKCILRRRNAGSERSILFILQIRPQPTLLVIYKREGWWRGKKRKSRNERMKRWRVEVNNNHGNGKYDFGSFLFSRAIRAK